MTSTVDCCTSKKARLDVLSGEEDGPDGDENPAEVLSGEETDTPSAFDGLPNELTVMILRRLNFATMKKARLVCSKWMDIVDENVKFVVPLSDENYDVVKNRMPRKTIEMAVTRFYRKEWNDEMARVFKDKDVKKIRFGPLAAKVLRDRDESRWNGFFTHEVGCRARRAPGPPENDIFKNEEHGISADNVLGILKSLPDVEQLTFASTALQMYANPSPRVVSGSLGSLNFKCVTSLEILFGVETQVGENSTSYPNEAYLQLLHFNHFPALRSFKFTSGLPYPDIRFFIYVYKFAIRHRQTITDLTIRFGSYFGHGYIYDDKWIRSNMTEDDYTKMVEDICQVRVVNLIFNPLVWLAAAKGRRELEQRFVTSQKFLRSVNLTCHSVADTDIFMVLKQSKYTLEEVTILGNFRHSEWLNCNCNVLSECLKLDKLVLDVTYTSKINEDISSRVCNFENLPQTITTLKINGFLLIEDAFELLDRLTNLQVLESNGCYNSSDSMSMFLKILNHRSIRRFRFINVEDCGPFVAAASLTPGVLQLQTRDSCPCAVSDTITFTIDRTTKLKIDTEDSYLDPVSNEADDAADSEGNTSDRSVEAELNEN